MSTGAVAAAGALWYAANGSHTVYNDAPDSADAVQKKVAERTRLSDAELTTLVWGANK